MSVQIAWNGFRLELPDFEFGGPRIASTGSLLDERYGTHIPHGLEVLDSQGRVRDGRYPLLLARTSVESPLDPWVTGRTDLPGDRPVGHIPVWTD